MWPDIIDGGFSKTAYFWWCQLRTESKTTSQYILCYLISGFREPVQQVSHSFKERPDNIDIPIVFYPRPSYNHLTTLTSAIIRCPSCQIKSTHIAASPWDDISRLFR